MVSENHLDAIFYEDDGENRVYCKRCDKLIMERFYKNHLTPQTHINNIRKRQQLKNNFYFICSSTNKSGLLLWLLW